MERRLWAISTPLRHSLRTPEYELTVNDWDSIGEFITFLEQPARVGTTLGQSTVVSISIAGIGNDAMIKHYNQHVSSQVGLIAQAAQAMLQQLIIYQQTLSCPTVRIARFLDSRMPRKNLSSEEMNDITRLIKEKLQRYNTDSINSDEAQPEDNVDENDFFAVFQAEQELERPGLSNMSVENEIERYNILISYKNAPIVPSKSNTLEWWNIKKKEYPRLYLLAVDILSIPASSVPAERANSLGGMVYDGRECLPDDTFKAEMCCASWLKLLKQHGFPIPVDFEESFMLLNYSDEQLLAMGEMDTVVKYFCDSELFQIVTL